MRDSIAVTTTAKCIQLQIGEEYYFENTTGSASDVILQQSVAGTYEDMVGSPIAIGESVVVVNISENPIIEVSVASGTATLLFKKKR